MLQSVTGSGYLLILMSVRFRKEIICQEKFVENAGTTKEISQSRRIVVMQSFAVAMKTAAVMEYRLCMTIVAKILKKRAIKGRKEKHGKN